MNYTDTFGPLYHNSSFTFNTRNNTSNITFNNSNITNSSGSDTNKSIYSYIIISIFVGYIFIIFLCIIIGYPGMRFHNNSLYTNTDYNHNDYDSDDFPVVDYSSEEDTYGYPEDYINNKNKQTLENVNYVLQETDIDTISIHSQVNCSVCLDIITKKDKVCILDCGHWYHQNCISQWVTSKILTKEMPECPLCRDDMEKLNLDICIV